MRLVSNSVAIREQLPADVYQYGTKKAQAERDGQESKSPGWEGCKQVWLLLRKGLQSEEVHIKEFTLQTRRHVKAAEHPGTYRSQQPQRVVCESD